MTRYTMKELPVSERPYEKLELYGEKSLSNAELLAIIIKSGTKEETSIQLAHRVINECCGTKDSLSIRNVSLDMLMNIKGIGRVKAICLKAAFELANRIGSTVNDRPFLSHSNLAGDYLVNVFRNDKQEKVKVLGLNAKGRLESEEVVSVGNLNSSSVMPYDVFRRPIECGCCDVLIAHNHPSGDPTPSENDILITARMIEAGRLLGINLLDHIVVGDGKYVSIRKSKLIKW